MALTVSEVVRETDHNSLTVRSGEREVSEERLFLVPITQKSKHTFRKIGRRVERSGNIFVRDLLATFDIKWRQKFHSRGVVLEEWLI